MKTDAPAEHGPPSVLKWDPALHQNNLKNIPINTKAGLSKRKSGGDNRKAGNESESFGANSDQEEAKRLKLDG